MFLANEASRVIYSTLNISDDAVVYCFASSCGLSHFLPVGPLTAQTVNERLKVSLTRGTISAAAAAAIMLINKTIIHVFHVDDKFYQRYNFLQKGE